MTPRAILIEWWRKVREPISCIEVREATTLMQNKKKIVKYIQELGKILQEKVQNSEEIEEILSKLRKEGVGLSLNFVAMVSGKSLNFSLGQVSTEGMNQGELKFEINEADKKFLKSIGISFE